MNLIQDRRDVVAGIKPALADQFDQILRRINFVWTVEHDPTTGVHTNITCESITVQGSVIDENGVIVDTDGTDGISLVAETADTARDLPIDILGSVVTLERLILLPSVTFATLPTGMPGMAATISDSTTTTWGATITGGGASTVMGFFNGTNWTVMGA